MQLSTWSQPERWLWLVMLWYQAGNVADFLTTAWGATTRPWPEQSGMAWAIHRLGPVAGPLWMKGWWAVAGYAYWRIGRWLVRGGVFWQALLVLAILGASGLWYAATSNLCVLILGRHCLPTWRL